MAGHSQFKNIMHRKGKQDAVRAKMFSKLSREITVAAKAGLPDPDANARLRLAIQNARAESMPKDNIERAIKKAIGGDAENYRQCPLRGLWPGRRRRHRRGADRQPQPHRLQRPLAVRQVRRQPGRIGLGRPSCSRASARSSIRPPRRADDAMLEAAIDAGADDVVSDETRPHRHLRLRIDRRGLLRAGQASSARPPPSRSCGSRRPWPPSTRRRPKA